MPAHIHQKSQCNLCSLLLELDQQCHMWSASMCFLFVLMLYLPCHAQTQRVLQEGGGSKFDHVFFWSIVDEDIEDPNAALNGPSLARKRNNI